LQSAHVYRRCAGQANWEAVAQLYDALSALTGSPVVAVNRALAIAESLGARAALDALQELAADARLTEYQPYWAARNCWPGQARMTKPAASTKSRSVSNAILRSAAFCSGVSRNYQFDSHPTLRQRRRRH